MSIWSGSPVLPVFMLSWADLRVLLIFSFDSWLEKKNKGITFPMIVEILVLSVRGQQFVTRLGCRHGNVDLKVAVVQLSATDTNLKEPWKNTISSSSKSPVNLCSWVRCCVSCRAAGYFTFLSSSLAETCLYMLSVLLSPSLKFWFISVFITSHFYFFPPLLFMFDILQSFSSTSHRCCCVDLSGAEGRLHLPHFHLNTTV